MHPPALIDTCMSFRNAQLQEVRTAPAAHGKGHPQEGPVACPTLDGQDAQVMVGWGLGREGCQRLLVRFYTVSPRIGQGGSRVVTMAEGAARGAGKGKAVPRCRRLIVEMRKGMPGGEGRRSRGGRPEAGLRVLTGRCPIAMGEACAPLSLCRGRAHRQQPVRGCRALPVLFLDFGAPAPT
jgi:hypothetical protein